MKKSLLILCLIAVAMVSRAYNDTYALVVAVADYKNFTYFDGDLRYTINDAKYFYVSEKGVVLVTPAMLAKLPPVSELS